MDDFLANSGPAPMASQQAPSYNNVYMNAAPAANNGWGNTGQQPNMGWGSPEQSMQTASMLYQQMGYYSGNPTEVDIISDLLKAQAPVAKFLASEKGLLILTQLFSTLFDYKMVNFFKNFKLQVMQDEAQNMFITPALEQTTEAGKKLAQFTSAEVQTEMSRITDLLRAEMLANSDAAVQRHRQAAQMKAQSSGLSNLLDEATGAKQGGGGLAKLVNFTARAAGMPVAPLNNNPPPPPGR